jgi:hypothetical protein
MNACMQFLSLSKFWDVTFPDEGRALIYKLSLMGLCKLKVQIKNGPRDSISKVKKKEQKRRIDEKDHAVQK